MRIAPIILVALLFTTISCKKRCESKKVGEISLLEISKSYAPFDDGQVLTYKNADGETLEGTVERIYSNADRHCVKYLCDLVQDPFEPIDCEYYESESIRNLYKINGDSVFIDLLVYSNLYEEENTLFYDGIQAFMSEVGSLAQGDYVIEPQFSEPTYEESQVPFLEQMVLESLVSLNGIDYENVLRTTEGENMLYIQAGAGIIGIKLDGAIWLLQ